MQNLYIIFLLGSTDPYPYWHYLCRYPYPYFPGTIGVYYPITEILYKIWKYALLGLDKGAKIWYKDW